MHFTKDVERLGAIPMLESDQIPICPSSGVVGSSYEGDELKRTLRTATRSVEISAVIATLDDRASHCRGSAVSFLDGAASSASGLRERQRAGLTPFFNSYSIKPDRRSRNVSYCEEGLSMARLCGVNLALWEGPMIHRGNSLRRSNIAEVE